MSINGDHFRRRGGYVQLRHVFVREEEKDKRLDATSRTRIALCARYLPPSIRWYGMTGGRSLADVDIESGRVGTSRDRSVVIPPSRKDQVGLPFLHFLQHTLWG